MAENRNIILIENQYRQFKLLSETLRKNDFSVFPDITAGGDAAVLSYRQLIDDVRIKLSDRYLTAKRTAAGVRITEYIKDKNPALFIVDHVLLGYSGSNIGTGIDLAKFIRDFNDRPIMFLSRTPENNIDVYRGLGEVIPPRLWLHKGFNGEKILKSDYITNAVIPEINLLIRTHQDYRVKRLLDSWLVIDRLKRMFQRDYARIETFRPERFDTEDLEYFFTFELKVLSNQRVESADFQALGQHILQLLIKKPN